MESIAKSSGNEQERAVTEQPKKRPKKWWTTHFRPSDPKWMHLLSEGSVMPAQMLKGQAERPERNLLLAILDDCVNILRKGPGRCPKLYDETVEWLSHDSGATVPLEDLCLYLNINAERLRTQLLNIARESEKKAQEAIKACLKDLPTGTPGTSSQG